MFAHRRNHAVHALEQHLFGISPGNAIRILLAHGGGFVGAGKCLVDLEQRRAFNFLGFTGRTRIGQEAANQLAQLIARAEQRDGVVVALAHLAAVQARQDGDMLVHCGLRKHKVLAAVLVVEAGGNVACHFNVLDLVAAHRHLVRLEHQDVGRHQHRVHEQAGGHAVVRVAPGGSVLVLRALVGMGPVEQALAGHAGQEPGELGNFGNVRLAVERHLLGVQAGSQPAGGNFQRRALDARRVFALDERVVVGQKVEALHARRAAGRNGGANGADKVAQVGRAGGGNAGQVARGAHGNRSNWRKR